MKLPVLQKASMSKNFKSNQSFCFYKMICLITKSKKNTFNNALIDILLSKREAVFTFTILSVLKLTY